MNFTLPNRPTIPTDVVPEISVSKVDREETVVSQFEITNWDLLRLINGGQLDSRGGLFSVRTSRKYERGNYNGRPTIVLTCQIITNGIDSPINYRNVIIKKEIKKEIVTKEVVRKPEVVPKAEMKIETKVERMEAW
jgi:hypothetical protein